MSQSTVYDVKLLYNVSGNAPQGLQSIGKQAEQVEKSTSSLGGALKALGATILGGLALHRGKQLFIDFNNEIETSKISLAAISRMFDSGMTFDRAMGLADAQFERYQEAAKKSTATTREFMQMHMSLAPTFAKFGVGAGVIEDIVKGSTLAAPILGERPEIFAMDVKQMLQGTVTNRDRSAVSLLAMMGVDKETFNQNTRKDVNYAIDLVQKALTSPAIKEAASRFEGSFAGVTSTLQDTIEILGAKAGQPIFKAITEEVKQWNEWLTKNDGLVREWTKDVGQKLVSGFGYIKSAVKFIVDNKAAIVSIATIWGGTAAIAGAMGGAAGIAANISKFVNSIGVMGSATESAATGMGSMVGQIGAVAGALGTLYLGLQLVAEWMDKWHADKVKGEGNIKALESRLPSALGGNEASQLAVRSFARGAGALDANNHFDMRAMAGYLQREGEPLKSAVQMADLVGRVLQRMNRPFYQDFPYQKDQIKEGPAKKPVDVNVNIQRVEVASDDPDRFVRGLVDIADKALNRPTQALSAHRI